MRKNRKWFNDGLYWECPDSCHLFEDFTANFSSKTNPWEFSQYAKAKAYCDFLRSQQPWNVWWVISWAVFLKLPWNLLSKWKGVGRRLKLRSHIFIKKFTNEWKWGAMWIFFWWKCQIQQSVTYGDRLKNIACAVVPHLERTESLRILKSNCSKLLRCNIERVAFDIAPTLWLLTTFHLFSQCSTHKFDKCKITVCLVRSHQNFVQRKSLYPHQVTSCTKHWLRQRKKQTKIQMMSLDRPWRQR